MTVSPVLHTVLEDDPHAALPCVYLVAENGLTLPAAYEEAMVALQNIRKGGLWSVVCGLFKVRLRWFKMQYTR